MNFVARYRKRAVEQKSVLCVGLDLTSEHVPRVFGDGLVALEQYARQVIRIAAGKVAVVKLQFAYYAAWGPEGIAVMVRLIEFAHSLGLLVILDAKRGDIRDTMVAYGKEVFDQYRADACTFIPYLGPTFMPSWLPWLAQGRMVVAMVRTSNPEAEQIQDLRLTNGDLVYECVARMVEGWNREVSERTGGEGSVGGVVGATWPQQAKRCRQLAPNTFFLVPGYGAQGGGAEGAVCCLLGRNELGETVGDELLLGTVSSSRGITKDSWYDKAAGKPKPGNPLELVALAIDAANVDLNAALAAVRGGKKS